MQKITVDKVFGVSNEEVLSYVERDQVDGIFQEALKTKKHIIVFGSSKQGKTALVNKQLKEHEYIKINCSPETRPIDIYHSLLRQIGVEIVERVQTSSGIESELNGNVSVNVKIPFFADGTAEIGSSISSNEERSSDFKLVEYNLALPQDIVEILKKYKFSKRIVIDNFHYLADDVQKTLAFDLRVFEDYNILFIILGIWREKNRLAQFNGDLQDRIFEIPVEPWDITDFEKVVSKGSKLLNIDLSKLTIQIAKSAFDSIGVFQELLKHSCYYSGVTITMDSQIVISNESLDKAIKKKVDDYSGRHIRSFETFIEQKTKDAEKVPLYMHYYFIKLILEEDFEKIHEGLKRKYIQEKIQSMHHRPEDVRPSDLTYFLHNITSSQIKRTIVPPLFDYDRSTKILKIIDSTLYFFLRNVNRVELLEEIPMPDGTS